MASINNNNTTPTSLINNTPTTDTHQYPHRTEMYIQQARAKSISNASWIFIIVAMLTALMASAAADAAPCAAPVAITDAELNTTLRLTDAQRGVIQLLATFPSTELHGHQGMAATLAAIKEAERDNLLPFHRINMTLVTFGSVPTAGPDVPASVLSHLVNNSGHSDTFPYTGVLGLFYGIADTVASSLINTTAANTPLVNPKTLAPSSLTSMYPNLLHYKPSIASEILHMVRFAFLQLSCANSDIHVSTKMGGDLLHAVEIIKREFKQAGFPEPGTVYTPDVGSTNNTAQQAYVDAALISGMGGRNVKCVFFLDFFRRDLHDLLLADARGASFFGTTSLLYTSIGVSSLPDFNAGQAAIYKSTYFTAAEPDVLGQTPLATQYRAALASFNTEHTESDHKLMNGNAVVNASAVGGYYPGDAADATPFGFENYVATRWLLQLLSASTPSPRDTARNKMSEQGVCNISSLNITAAFPSPLLAPDASSVVDAAYKVQVHVSPDLTVGPLASNVCSLSSGTSTSSSSSFFLSSTVCIFQPNPKLLCHQS